MSAEVIPFSPRAHRFRPAAESAWEAYDAAQRVACALYHDPASTAQERLDASLKAIRLHADLVRALGVHQ